MSSEPNDEGTGQRPSIPQIPGIERVVIPLGVGRPIEATLRWATRLTEALDADTVLLAPGDTWAAYAPDATVTRPAETEIEWPTFVALAGEDADLVVTDVDEYLRSELSPRDLVLVGTGEVVGVTRFALGAASHALVRELDAPILVVPWSDRTDAGRGPVVVAVGGHAEAEINSLVWAEQLAGALGHEVIGLHAVDPASGTSDDAGERGDDDRLARRMADRAGLQLIERSAAPADACRAVVSEVDAVVLVVSAKQRHSLGGRLVGRVADALLHAPPAPLAIVPHGFASG